VASSGPADNCCVSCGLAAFAVHACSRVELPSAHIVSPPSSGNILSVPNSGSCCVYRYATQEDPASQRSGGRHASGTGAVRGARLPGEAVLADGQAGRRGHRRPRPVQRSHLEAGVRAPRSPDLGAVHARESQPHAVAGRLRRTGTGWPIHTARPSSRVVLSGGRCQLAIRSWSVSVISCGYHPNGEPT